MEGFWAGIVPDSGREGETGAEIESVDTDTRGGVDGVF